MAPHPSFSEIAPSASIRDCDSAYGVLAFVSWNHDWNNYHFSKKEDLERVAKTLQDTGIRWVRMDFLWADIEPNPGELSFARYDALVAILQAHDLRILGVLNYNPLWSEGGWNSAPDAESYIKYARATVAHFKNRIQYWEIWNEPDHAVYWEPQDQLRSYSALLKAVAPAIREEDPTARVVMGGLSQNYPFHLRDLYRLAGKESFDVVNIHPFVDPLNPKRMAVLKGIYTAVKKVMEEFQDNDKPIWFTEIGCPGVSRKDKAKTWWLGKATTEEQQADWLTEVYAEPLTWPGVDKIFWAFLRDTGSHFGNAVDDFGLMKEDFSPKPALAAYREATTRRL